MPIALDSLPTADVTAMTLPGSVTVTIILHATGEADTKATATYTIDPSSDVFMVGTGGPAKTLTAGPFVVPVVPGVVRADRLALVRGKGEPRALLPIALAIQQCNAAGVPIGSAQNRNVVIQIL